MYATYNYNYRKISKIAVLKLAFINHLWPSGKLFFINYFKKAKRVVITLNRLKLSDLRSFDDNSIPCWEWHGESIWKPEMYIEVSLAHVYNAHCTQNSKFVEKVAIYLHTLKCWREWDHFENATVLAKVWWKQNWNCIIFRGTGA